MRDSVPIRVLGASSSKDCLGTSPTEALIPASSLTTAVEGRPAILTTAPKPPKIQKFVLEEDRGSPVLLIALAFIILVAVGVILYSFKIV